MAEDTIAGNEPDEQIQPQGLNRYPVDEDDARRQIERAPIESLCETIRDIHRSYREKVVHEDNLINIRTSWLLVSQTLMLGPSGYEI